MSIETKRPAASMQETQDFRRWATDAEKLLSENGGLVGPDSYVEFPVSHEWGHKCYVREVNSPANALVVTKIHKFRHPFFLLEGEVSVMTESGLQRIAAPHYGMTEPGTKRVIYTHTKTKWVTVHGTDLEDPAEVEEEIIAKDFNDPEVAAADMQRIAQVDIQGIAQEEQL